MSSVNYIQAVGPTRCVRCDWYKTTDSQELIKHLNEFHPGWSVETHKKNTILPEFKTTSANEARQIDNILTTGIPECIFGNFPKQTAQFAVKAYQDAVTDLLYLLDLVERHHIPSVETEKELRRIKSHYGPKNSH